MLSNSRELPVEQLENSTFNIAEFLCGGFSHPVTAIMRPFYGTRYCPPVVTFLSFVMLLVAVAISAALNSAAHMIPFFGAPAPRGMFDIADFAQLYLILTFVHGVRLWRRMLDMSKEKFSTYEEPGLPFFAWLPKGQSFWVTRIVYEPLFVWLISIVLQDLLIIQYSLALYLRLAALALVMKGCLAWFHAWQPARQIMDTRNAAPILAKLVDDTATEEDLTPIHLASFPRNLDPEIRKAAAQQLAHTYLNDK